MLQPFRLDKYGIITSGDFNRASDKIWKFQKSGNNYEPLFGLEYWGPAKDLTKAGLARCFRIPHAILFKAWQRATAADSKAQLLAFACSKANVRKAPLTAVNLEVHLCKEKWMAANRATPTELNEQGWRICYALREVALNYSFSDETLCALIEAIGEESENYANLFQISDRRGYKKRPQALRLIEDIVARLESKSNSKLTLEEQELSKKYIAAKFDRKDAKRIERELKRIAVEEKRLIYGYPNPFLSTGKYSREDTESEIESKDNCSLDESFPELRASSVDSAWDELRDSIYRDYRLPASTRNLLDGNAVGSPTVVLYYSPSYRFENCFLTGASFGDVRSPAASQSRSHGGNTIYRGRGRPRNTDYGPDGKLRRR